MTSWPITPLVAIDDREGSGSETIVSQLPVKCSAATSGTSYMSIGDSVKDISLTTAPDSPLNHCILSQLDVVHAGHNDKRLQGNGSPAIIKCQFSPFTTPLGPLTPDFSTPPFVVSPSSPVTTKPEAFIVHKNFTSDKKNQWKKVGPISSDVTYSRARSDVGCVSDKNATNNSTRGHRSPPVTSHAGTSPGSPPLSLSSLEESSAESWAAVLSSKSVAVPSTSSSLTDVCTADIHSSRGELQSWHVSESDRKQFTIEAYDECHSDSLKSRDIRDISFVPHHQNKRRHSSSGLHHKNYTRNLLAAQSDLDLSKQHFPDGVSFKLSQAQSNAPRGKLSQSPVNRLTQQENEELITSQAAHSQFLFPESFIEISSHENFKITESNSKSRNKGNSPDQTNSSDVSFINNGLCSSPCPSVNDVTYDVICQGMIDVSLCHSGTRDTRPPMVSEGLDSSFTSQPFDDVKHTDNGDAHSQLSAAAPTIQVTTSSTEVTPNITENDISATSNELVSAFDKSSGIQPSKLRDTFINGLRRLSREKNTFLRIDQSYNCGRPDTQDRTSSSRTFLFPGPQAQLSNSPTGRAVSPGERRKLKVEFAVMEEEGHKLNRSKVRGARIEAGVKDEVDNHVAMLGGSSARFRQPRVSLLGKPLNYRAHRRDMRYRRIQARIYNFLERPKHWGSWMYHFVMFAFVLLCLTLGVLSSINELESDLIHSTVYLELVMLLWIAVELGLRVWSAGCRSRHQGLTGRLRFLRRPLCIIDIILVIASVTTMIVGTTQEHFPQAVLSGLRFFQILRMVRMDRKGGTWKLLGSVVWAHRQELVTTLYIGLLGLIFSSYFVYLAEKDEPKLDSGNSKQYNSSGYKPKFSNFADAIWWGVVTLCTVGYGDVVPASWGGKLIAAFSAILGISFFALPAGILGSGFALKVQQQQRQKHLNRRRVPAANLIQCLWRCYAADEHSISTATWKPHMIPCPSPPSERSFKNNTSFVSRFSTRRRDRSNTINSNSSHTNGQAQSPMTVRHHSRRTAISTSDEEVPNVLDSLVNRTWSHLSLATGLTDHKLQLDMLPFKKENSVTSIGKESEEEPDLSPRLTQLTDQHKKVIRAIRKMKYFVARRKFREALRPYDVKDVIEQYSAGHVDMLGRIKNLQGRLDQILGRQGSKSKDVYESKICLASRIVKVERQVDDIETKIDMLVDMYKEDRKLLLQHLHQSCQVHGSVGDQHTQAPAPAVSSTTTPQFKPRPILVEKQFTSEPATPTALTFPGSNGGRGKPIIQRNLSDLSQRIKKRVTYHPLSLHDPPSRAQSAASFTNSVAMSSIFSNTSDSPSFQQNLTQTAVNNVSTEHDDQCSQFNQSKQDVDINETHSTEPQSSFKSRDFQPHKLLHQPSSISLPPISTTTLSTLSEQRSVESDSSLSCGEVGHNISPTINSTSSEQTLPTSPTSLLLASANQLKESYCCHGDRHSSALSFSPTSTLQPSITEDLSESNRQDLLHDIII